MNRRILNIVIGLLAFIGSANAQTLSVASVEATAGEQKTLTVSLSDAASATALQFNLSLPANVTINESGCALGSAASNHTLRVSRMDNGNYLFVIFSMDFTKLGNGTLLTIPVIFANDATSGNGNLFTVRSSASDAVSYQHQNATFAVNVNTTLEKPKCATPTIAIKDGKLHFECETEGVKFIYDIQAGGSTSGEGNDLDITPSYVVKVYATKDGYEDSDVATETINIIKGDVDGDGVIDIADAVRIVNFIVGKIPALAPRIEINMTEPE